MENELNNNQNQADQSQEQNPGGDNTKASKTFTQEEVNEIVKSRLSREHSRLDAAQEKQAQYEAREAELQEREFALQAKEAMLEKGLPVELASIIKTTDAEGIGKAVELLAKHVKGNTVQNTEKPQGFQIGGGKQEEMDRVAMYREAMGLK